MAFITTHPLDPEDGALMATMRAASSPRKGLARGIGMRGPFDAMMEGVLPYDNNLTFESDTIGGVPGVWVHPAHYRPEEAILHLHAGWFNFGSARAFRNLVGHLAARAGARAFIPDYRLAPEHPFPAAIDDVEACYRGLDERNIRRVAVTGDSAGGNLALALAARVTSGALVVKSKLVGLAALSPVTDLTLSGASYETRAVAEPYFTREQVAELVGSYLGSADPNDPRASPLQAKLHGLPPLRIHVGEDEVLLDDSRRYVERAVASGVDAHLDVWQGLAHGFAASVGKMKAATHALEALGTFLAIRLQATT
jgi:monoterpene epsilon-lactone hydrolase